MSVEDVFKQGGEEYLVGEDCRNNKCCETIIGALKKMCIGNGIC